MYEWDSECVRECACTYVRACVSAWQPGKVSATALGQFRPLTTESTDWLTTGDRRDDGVRYRWDGGGRWPDVAHLMARDAISIININTSGVGGGGEGWPLYHWPDPPRWTLTDKIKQPVAGILWMMYINIPVLYTLFHRHQTEFNYFSCWLRTSVTEIEPISLSKWTQQVSDTTWVIVACVKLEWLISSQNWMDHQRIIRTDILWRLMNIHFYSRFISIFWFSSLDWK